MISMIIEADGRLQLGLAETVTPTSTTIITGRHD
jgi:hypothetical protein